MQINRGGPVYDVVVIGSGAGGGTTVKVLTDLGVSVALIEAGPMLNPAKDFKEHMWPSQLKERGAEPFLIPAMGSHGGATAEGQIEMMAGYGMTEEALGCPARATMDVVELGKTARFIISDFPD